MVTRMIMKTEALKDKLTMADPRGTKKRRARVCQQHSRCFPRPAAAAAVHRVQRIAIKNSGSLMQAQAGARLRMMGSVLDGLV
jgi:hypothetical protein